MSSILTNNSAMTALSTLRNINNDLSNTQNKISTGLKISSGKDNAAYFSISKTMSGDSGMYKAIDENLTLQQNAVSTARLGSETLVELANSFVERVAFAQGGTAEVRADVQAELDELVARMNTTIAQSTFNGTDYVSGAAATVSVVTGISRTATGVTTTSMTFMSQNLSAIATALGNISLLTGAADTATEQATHLKNAESALGAAIASATALGIAEKSIETQKDFLSELTDRLDSGVGAMIDADMESEAARLQALQVQQQLATQSLSIANSSPQNILSLFQ